MDDQGTNRDSGEGVGANSLVRIYVYLHFAAAAFAGFVSYYERSMSFTVPGVVQFCVVAVAFGSLPILLVLLAYLLCTRRIDQWNKSAALIVGLLATLAQIVALIPKIQ
jgi:hypothetical protein